MGRSSTGYLTTAAFAAAASVMAGGTVRAAEPTPAQLMEQIQQLQAKVQQLETTQQSQASLSGKEVDATVERVLNDADRRSQLLQMEGFTAGYNKGKFLIQDAAGNWSMHPYLQFQFRSTTNYTDDGKQAGEDADIENGFEVRRLKAGIDGTAFNPNVTYNFLWATSSSGGSVGLEQAWVKYVFADDWAVRAGQIVNPVFHEQTTSARRLQAVDRSLANTLITGTNEAFSQAVSIQYGPKEGALFVEAGLEDGFISGNTDFVDPNEGGTNNFGVFARVNYFVHGQRSAYDDFSAMGNKEDLLVIGGGGDMTQTGDSNAYLHTVDVQWENTSGLGIYAAYLGNFVDSDAGGDLYNWGFLAQAGYMLNDKWEVFGRYDYTKIDEDSVAPGAEDSFSEITLGVNYFIAGGHAAKISVDFSYLPDGAPSDIKGIGILGSGEDEYMVRAQFQLLL